MDQLRRKQPECRRQLSHSGNEPMAFERRGARGSGRAIRNDEGH
jgi:hypothetical protein